MEAAGPAPRDAVADPAVEAGTLTGYETEINKLVPEERKLVAGVISRRNWDDSAEGEGLTFDGAAALAAALVVDEVGLALLLLLLQPATRHAVATTAMVTPVRLNFIDFSSFGVAHGTGAVSRELLRSGGGSCSRGRRALGYCGRLGGSGFGQPVVGMLSQTAVSGGN